MSKNQNLVSSFIPGDFVVYPSHGVGKIIGTEKRKVENVELEFNDEAILEIARKAISKKTGARGLRSILENILLKTMFDLPDMENVVKVTVDRSAVNGTSVPIVTYGKKPSTSVA